MFGEVSDKLNNPLVIKSRLLFAVGDMFEVVGVVKLFVDPWSERHCLVMVAIGRENSGNEVFVSVDEQLVAEDANCLRAKFHLSHLFVVIALRCFRRKPLFHRNEAL